MFVTLASLCIFYQLKEFSWIMRLDAIQDQLCEIAPSPNIRSLDLTHCAYGVIFLFNRKVTLLWYISQLTHQRSMVWTGPDPLVQHLQLAVVIVQSRSVEKVKLSKLTIPQQLSPSFMCYTRCFKTYITYF